jgi:hypothetical protein
MAIAEKNWDGYYDADIIARAEVIKADEARMKAAQPHLENMLKEKQALTAALNKLVKKGGKKNGL